ncbi:MAG: hypothetical protein OXH15_07795 [Gammaproteobacteria bacterium]|nr:hypothetical protein [Gammaproteobacteria bacterium]
MADIHKALTIAALCVMVVGIGFTLANAWFFFLADPALSETSPRTLDRVDDDRGVPIAEVTALHLFGRSRATAGGAGGIAATENLRDTRLSLELVGVFVATMADESRALIAQKGRAPETYAPGDRLPGNARLVDVYWNRVVISRAGQHELIRFEHDTGNIQRIEGTGIAPQTAEPQAAAVVESARPRGPGRDARQAVHRYREAFEQNPEQALADAGIALAPDRDGYVVGALTDLFELSHAGLQAGDRILSVNGLAVGEPGADSLKIEDSLANGAARLEIQRGDRRFFVTVPVN